MSFENLEQIGDTYYASMHVPPDVREALGKRRLRKSLRTKDKRTAIHRARLIIDGWWQEIHQARKALKSLPDKLTQDALAWREELKARGLLRLENDPEILEALLTDEAQRLEESRGTEAAATFYGIATGKITPIKPLIDQWQSYAAKSVKPKTLSMYVSDVTRMAQKLDNLEDLSKSKVRGWLWGLAEESPEGMAEATQRRILNGVSNFWRWAHAQGLMSEDAANPTIGIELHKGAKTVHRIPFTPEQITAIWSKAKAKKDQALADLIYLGAYTGGGLKNYVLLPVPMCPLHGISSRSEMLRLRQAIGMCLFTATSLRRSSVFTETARTVS